MERMGLKFVIVGHVDHGKSTLIGRLLYDTNSLPPDKIEEIQKTSKALGRETEFAYLLDHLEEERQQGITIDTTQVFFKTEKREYVIIDAPGHVEFVKNMITGASQAEAAVLIIDVNEGVKEQTKRHSYILSLLGLKQVIVVLNKMDMVGFQEIHFAQIKKEIEEFLRSINISPIFYIPIAALSGENIAKRAEKMVWYKGPTFLESLDSLENREATNDKPLIFPIQDIYKIDSKRIAVGRVEAGVLRSGQEIKVYPSRQLTKVKSIEKYPKQVNEASAGESIGITVEASLFLDRGYVVCDSGEDPVLTDTFRASVFWMARKEFNKGERIMVRCSTQETSGKMEVIRRRINSSTLEVIAEEADELGNLEVGEVIIKTKNPIVIKTFQDVQELGRFVMVRDEDICAGGIITAID